MFNKELKPKKIRDRKNIMIDSDKVIKVKQEAEKIGRAESDIYNKALDEYLSKRSSVKILTFLNQKGGCGKTTSVQNICAALVEKGRKVLCIDLDPQGNLTKGLGAYNQEAPSIFEVLKGEVLPQDAIVTVHNFDLIPSDMRLSAFEYIEIPGKELLLKNRLKNLNLTKYDYVVIDCAPSFGKLNLGALSIATSVYVPMQTEYYAMEGVTQLLQTIDLARNILMNETLDIKGVFATMYNNRRNLDKIVVEKIEEFFGNKFMKTKIRENVKLAEAPVYKNHIYEYDKKSLGAIDYMNLTEEILELEEN